MSTITIELAANNVLEALNVKAQAGWSLVAVTDNDGTNCVCLNSVIAEVCFTTLLIVTNDITSYQLWEYDTSGDTVVENTTNFTTLIQLLTHVRVRMDICMHGEEISIN